MRVIDNFNYIHFLLNKRRLCSLEHRDLYGAQYAGDLKGADVLTYIKRIR